MTKLQWSLAALLFSAAASPAHADEMNSPVAPQVVTSTHAFIPSAALAPGRYVVAVTPDFNKDMGKRLQAALHATPGISDVKTLTKNSTIHFTLKEGNQLRMTDIQKVVAKAYPTAAITTPVLEGTMTPKISD
jgi:hypothetical protein